MRGRLVIAAAKHPTAAFARSEAVGGALLGNAVNAEE